MQHRKRRIGRPLALATAAAFGLGGLLIAPAAFATNHTELFPVSGSAYEQQAKALLADSSVQAVGRDAKGNIVVVKKLDDDSNTITALSKTYSNVIVKQISTELTHESTDDVVAGAGYFTPDDPDAPTSGSACSIGFTAWSPTGKPALISAGHCTDDGTKTDTYLTLPTGDDAGGSTSGFGIVSKLGTFGFSQFGGPGNTAGANDKNSVDVSVIDVTNTDLTLLPEVTDWTSAESEDLSKSTKVVTSVGVVDPAKAISKSGRTTGFTSAPDVDIVDGWANVSERIVYGFGVEGLGSDHGDSGGALIQGGTAVGILSGGSPASGTTPSFTWASDLVNDLTKTGGYTVQLKIAAPSLTSPADGGSVERGALITGTAPVGSTVVVNPTQGDTFEVSTDAAGGFSFLAPGALGSYDFSLTAKSGFNTSSAASFGVKVVAAPLTAPVISSPADGSKVTTSLDTVSGTGTPGATITVTGDIAGTTTVKSDGTWSVTVKAELSLGANYSVTVTQSAEGQTSPAATSTFSVVPTAPGILTPVNNAVFANQDAPKTATGTGLTGATITATLNGQALGSTTVEDGEWSLPLGNTVIVGSNLLVVRQSTNGVASLAQIAFTLNEVVNPTPTTPAPAPTTPGTPGGGSGSGSTGGGSGTGGGLANTGLDALGFGALSLLLVGAGVLTMVFRKRRSASDSL